MEDLNGREFIFMGVLALAVLALGVYPAPLLDVMKPSLDHLLQLMLTSKL